MSRQAAVGVLTRSDGRILTVWNKRYVGWTLPGGMVEAFESPVQALAREFREETGLVVSSATPIYEAPIVPRIAGRGELVTVFRVATEHHHARACEPSGAVNWITWDEFFAWCPFAEWYRAIDPRTSDALSV